MNKENIVKRKMIAFDHGDPKRIQHFLKVASFANMIAIEEGLAMCMILVLLLQKVRA